MYEHRETRRGADPPKGADASSVLRVSAVQPAAGGVMLINADVLPFIAFLTEITVP